MSRRRRKAAICMSVVACKAELISQVIDEDLDDEVIEELIDCAEEANALLNHGIAVIGGDAEEEEEEDDDDEKEKDCD